MSRKKKRFDVVSAVKSVAREQVGQPKPTRVEPSEKTERVRGAGRGAKHKATLETLRRDDGQEENGSERV